MVLPQFGVGECLGMCGLFWDAAGVHFKIYSGKFSGQTRGGEGEGSR